MFHRLVSKECDLVCGGPEEGRLKFRISTV